MYFCIHLCICDHRIIKYLINIKEQMIRTFLTVLIFLIISPLLDPALAQDKGSEYYKGTVNAVIEEAEYYDEALDLDNIYQELKVLIKTETGEKLIDITVGDEYQYNQVRYKVGDKVLVQGSSSSDTGSDLMYSIHDFDRSRPLLILLLGFVVLTLLISKTSGLQSFLGLIISIFAVFGLIIPGILKGYDPILISILVGIFLIPTTFYISHGFSRKSTLAVIGTVISLLITGIIGSLSVKSSYLTGQGLEESFFLQTQSEQNINIANLIIGGIIISLIGILDDVTISQVSIVEQLKDTNREISPSELFRRAMTVGRDHISSITNTLILTYSGASIPILLIFSLSNTTFSEVVNLEIVAVEIVRTLVGSIGLLLAIPITTLIATRSFAKR